MFSYVTADDIGIPTGGGTVTYHELKALQSLGPTKVYSRKEILDKVTGAFQDPWGFDDTCKDFVLENELTHFYSGTFSKTVQRLKEKGKKVTYTVAAHDVDLSKREHEKLGIPFAYPHLVISELWNQYTKGYSESDILICPSNRAANIMRKYGRIGSIQVIPHGVNLPEKVLKFPNTFTVGYLGALGPDKGIIYLLEAWKKLNYKDSLLVIGGRDSISTYMYNLLNRFGGGNICLSGWMNDVSDFYNSITCYIQPSVTEGFGIEVLEAYAHGRSVICSDGAGAADVVPEHLRFKACDVDGLCQLIDFHKKNKDFIDMESFKAIASNYTWDKICNQYCNVWKGLL